MAAGDSPTSIGNLALSMLSEDPIANISPPDNNKRGRLCQQFYDTSRRSMLNAHPWRCAKAQAQLAASTTVPLFTYGHAFPVPADFIRSFELPEDDTQRWELLNIPGIGRVIATDAGTPLDFVYVFDLQDTTLMEPLLVQAIAADMASLMAWPLSRDFTLKKSCMADREAYLSAARTASAQQGSPRQLNADLMLRSRW